MSVKLKTITLAYYGRNREDTTDMYVVRQITDSVDYRPGEFLTKAQVKELCDAKDWKVINRLNTEA